MNLIRVAARTMLAGYFVANGAKALKEPEAYAAETERFATTVVPLAKRVAPPEVATSIPEDAVTLARIAGAMQVIGGLGLMTGKGRRLGASAIATAMLPQLVAANPLKGASGVERAANRNDLLKNLALTGAALLAANDTEGKPSLSWRAQDQSRRIARSVDQTRRQLEADASKSKRQVAREIMKARKNARAQVKALSA
ncbi:DoxX family protein [Mariniluteicoccus flavus]